MKEKIVYILIILNIFLSVKLFYKIEDLKVSAYNLTLEDQYLNREIKETYSEAHKNFTIIYPLISELSEDLNKIRKEIYYLENDIRALE